MKLQKVNTLKHRTPLSALIILLGMLFSEPQACINPADRWAAGVAFNNGETVQFAMIDSIGMLGSDYGKSGSGDSLKYTYRSHYAPARAMVYLGYFSISYQPGAGIPRLAILLDTTQDAASFDFAAAVRVELDWLCNPVFGVLVMSCAERRQAEDSLRAAGHGNAQYWTKQHKVLSYNQWFTGDTLDGAWQVNGVRGSCGLDAAFALPSDTLKSLSLGHNYVIDPGNARFAVTDLNTNTLTMVDAVKEPGGQYYYLFMKRLPAFQGKVVKGYFDKDSVMFTGANSDVFIMTEIAGDRSASLRIPHSSATVATRRGLVRAIAVGPANTAGAFDIRGRAIQTPCKGMQIIIRQAVETR